MILSNSNLSFSHIFSRDCAGVYNSQNGDKIFHVNAVALYYSFSPTSPYKHGIYLGTPALMTRLCTGAGKHPCSGDEKGRRCGNCDARRKKRGSSAPSSFLNKWHTTFVQAIERRSKETLTIADRSAASSFEKISDKFLSEEGIELREEAKSQVVYYDYMMNTLPKAITSQLVSDIDNTAKAKATATVTRGVPSDKLFITKVAKLYEDNKNFRESLVVGLLRAAVNRTQGSKCAAMEEKVINFYRFVSTWSPMAAQVMSANLQGPGKRWLRKLNARDRTDCILDGGHDAVVLRMVNAAKDRAVDGSPVTFSLAIDATKVAKVCEISSAYQALVGGGYPNHNVNIAGMDSDDVKSILNGTSKSTKIDLATEVKVAVMSFQSTEKGVAPSIVVAARPQSNNETSNFVQAMELAASKAAKELAASEPAGATNYRFAGFAVDGVSVEGEDVRRSICDFLSSKCNHVGYTDTNHNMKSWRYQIVGGSCVVTIGKYVVDADLLRIAEVPRELWRPTDFASDLLVLKLVSYQTVKKLHDFHTKEKDNLSPGDIGVLMVTLAMTKLRLHAINSKDMDSNQRSVYSWVSMLWFTSLTGACITTKRNLVAEAISFAFLLLRDDVKRPRNLTSEPAEHEFGSYRSKIREFSTLDFCHLVESNHRRNKMMFSSNLAPSRDPQKGYQATTADYVEYNRTGNLRQTGGPVSISADGDAVAKQLWTEVSIVIDQSSRLMRKFLLSLGVTEEEISPFCRKFADLTDLRDTFIEYCPQTFKYDGVDGSGEDDRTVEATTGDVTDEEKSRRMHEEKSRRMRRFVNDVLGPPAAVSATPESIETVNDVAVADGEIQSNSVTQDSTVNYNDAAIVSNEAQSIPGNGTDIITAIHMLWRCVDISNLSQLALRVSAAIDSKIEGSITSERKAKSLQARWFARSASKITSVENGNGDEFWIERGTIVTVGATLRKGPATRVVNYKYRVLAVYEKSYNKWFMTEKKKKWMPNMEKEEKKKFKFQARMVVDEVGVYVDVSLDDKGHPRNDKVRIVDGAMVVAVVDRIENTL